MQKIFLVILFFVLTSCGGGGGGGSSTSTGTTTSSYSGVAIDGNLYLATAFLDLNGNGTYDSGEPTATTDSSGAFTLTATADQISSHSVVVSAIAGTTIDQDSPNTPITSSMTLMAPAGSPSVISPLTTQVSAKMAAGMSLDAAKSAVQTELGLTGVDVTKNYVAEKAANSAYADAHKVAASIAEILKNIDSQSSGSTTLASKLSSLTTNVTSSVVPIASQIKSAANLDDARTATNTKINAVANIYSIGGAITGLNSNGLVLANGTNTISPAANDSTFTFPTKKAKNAAYSVTVQTNPDTQTCTVTSGSGTVASQSISNISITCVDNFGALSGTVTGHLVNEGVILQNGTELLPIYGSTSFTFANKLKQGDSYSISVYSETSGRTCSISNGTGTMTASGVSNVRVTCATNTYNLGGTISGLVTSGLKLKNSSELLSVGSGSNTFTFAYKVAYGGGYSVTVDTQPSGYTCSLSNSSGEMGAANVTSVQLTCAPNAYQIQGIISNLNTDGLVLKVGNQTTRPSSGSTGFSFNNSIAYGTAYSVTIDTQPAHFNCTVTNGSGTVSSNVSNVSIDCGTRVTRKVTVIGSNLPSGVVINSGLDNFRGGATYFSFGGETTLSSGNSSIDFTGLDELTSYTVKLTSPSGYVCTSDASIAPVSNAGNYFILSGDKTITVTCQQGYQVNLRNVIVPIPVQTGGIPILQTQYITDLVITFTTTVNGSTTTQVIPRSSISPTMAPQLLSVPYYMNYSLGILQSGATYTFGNNKPSCQIRINDAAVNPTISGSNSTLNGTINQNINFDLVCPSAGI